MIIDEVCKIVNLSFSKDTCYPKLRDEWNLDNNTLGHCAIAALILNDFLGGKIMRCECESGSHYYNLINDKIIDITVYQFDSLPNYKMSEERTREYLLSNEDTKNRYKLLLERVKENFLKYGKKDYKLLTKEGIVLSKIPGTLGGNKKLKIYGKLDCKCALNWIKKGYYVDNRVFFENEEVAKLNNYRPCGICMKKEYKLWKEKNMLDSK